uniref:Protein YIPF n=1 Tax=Guillardia theta TaxID=55529 RepID=A0A7S4UT54_GUITH|mmetsp:Transcript_45913/g.144040  ORF Transcript_45913/g.144040 Transcript_45913/m.144040 type:complete len:181 (+) Transcript_45913:204-746(+)
MLISSPPSLPFQVALPGSDSKKELKNWDLWGPLFLCLILAITLSSGSSHAHGMGDEDESAPVFASVFVIVWCGAAVVTVNAVLLGGTVSFFQSICVLGYCVFPLVISALICMTVGWMKCKKTACVLVRFGMTAIGLIWASRASVGFLNEVVSPKRAALAAYPVYLFYTAIAWIILIRSSP